jgi:L-lactate dehydrogenase complex protein LldG
MNSRDDILQRIRAGVGRSAANLDAARARVDAALVARAQGPRPPDDGDLVARFRKRSEALSSTVDQVVAIEETPAAVERYLSAHALPRRAVVVPQLARLDWVAAGLAVEARAAGDADLVGITGCFCAIAETGTLMLCSSASSPATTSLLPETHIAIVDCGRIVAGMEEGWQLARDEFGELPRAVNFVSGPSRTGDIEQTIVLGAHGPYRVHLIVVTG